MYLHQANKAKQFWMTAHRMNMTQRKAYRFGCQFHRHEISHEANKAEQYMQLYKETSSTSNAFQIEVCMAR